MQYKFNFTQVANWVWILRTQLKELRSKMDSGQVQREQVIELANRHIHMIDVLIRVLNRQADLQGLGKDFASKIDEIKADFSKLHI